MEVTIRTGRTEDDKPFPAIEVYGEEADTPEAVAEAYLKVVQVLTKEDK